jgi:cobalt/nickel transport system ATP-binding protein
MKIENLHYTYEDGTQALKGINMVFHKGDTIAILGGNGAGKSTLFLHMNGILRPQKGQITLLDHPITYTKEGLRALKKQVGIVFQDPDNQLFSASVLQDVSFGPMNLKLPLDDVKSKVEAAMASTGVTGLKDKPTHKLSYGQKKRVAIAGVLAMEPELLILDEPTAGLDPQGVSEIMQLLKGFQKERGLTVIIATHDIDMVPLYADYVYILEEGSIILEGAPQSVFSEAKVMRQVHLRLPRIAHFMEILKNKDGLQFDSIPSTISAARHILLQWFKDKT